MDLPSKLVRQIAKCYSKSVILLVCVALDSRFRQRFVRSCGIGEPQDLGTYGKLWVSFQASGEPGVRMFEDGVLFNLLLMIVYQFALKSVAKSQVVQLGQQDHIMSEKRVMAKLSSPFIVRL